jgi:hypothetical protein
MKYTYFIDHKATVIDVAHTSITKAKDKGKALPLQAYIRPEGSRKLRLPEFSKGT